MSDWADEKAKRLLNDPWGAPVAGDVVDGVAQALREARAEGIEAAAKYLETAHANLHHGTGWATLVRQWARDACPYGKSQVDECIDCERDKKMQPVKDRT